MGKEENLETYIIRSMGEKKNISLDTFKKIWLASWTVFDQLKILEDDTRFHTDVSLQSIYYCKRKGMGDIRTLDLHGPFGKFPLYNIPSSYNNSKGYWPPEYYKNQSDQQENATIALYREAVQAERLKLSNVQSLHVDTKKILQDHIKNDIRHVRKFAYNNPDNELDYNDASRCIFRIDLYMWGASLLQILSVTDIVPTGDGPLPKWVDSVLLLVSSMLRALPRTRITVEEARKQYQATVQLIEKSDGEGEGPAGFPPTPEG